MNDDVEILHIITEPTRYEILCLLLRHTYCVRALARKLGISEPAVSQHMNVFKRYGLVTGQKYGYQMHYRVERERVLAALESVSAAFNMRLYDDENAVSRSCTCEFASECSRSRKIYGGEQ